MIHRIEMRIFNKEPIIYKLINNWQRDRELRLAKRAWKEGWIGSKRAGKWLLVKDEKTVTVSPHHDNMKYGMFDILVFPKAEHLPKFKNAVKGVTAGTEPGGKPGAIGQLHFYYEPKEVMETWFVQSNYMLSGRYALPKTLHEFYAGWRKRALKAAIKTAHNLKVPLLIRTDTVNRSWSLRNELMKVMKEAAATHSEEERNGIRYWAIKPE